MAKNDQAQQVKIEEARNWKDPWVARLILDPNENPEVVLLTGYIGDAPEDDSIRAFLDAQLQQWVDVPLEAILYRESIPKNVSALGGSHLWIKRSSWSKCKRGEVKTDPQSQTQGQQFSYWGQFCNQPQAQPAAK